MWPCLLIFQNGEFWKQFHVLIDFVYFFLLFPYGHNAATWGSKIPGVELIFTLLRHSYIIFVSLWFHCDTSGVIQFCYDFSLYRGVGFLRSFLNDFHLLLSMSHWVWVLVWFLFVRSLYFERIFKSHILSVFSHLSDLLCLFMSVVTVFSNFHIL